MDELCEMIEGLASERGPPENNLARPPQLPFGPHHESTRGQ